MTTHETFHGDIPFEVTAEMRMALRPLGEEPEDLHGPWQKAQALTAIKGLIHQIDSRLLPTGFWDCYPDEGHWDWDCEKNEAIELPCDCPGGEHKGDDVFVRIPMSHWDESLQVFARGGDVTINGESYSPQDCMTDILALLRVAQLFIKRGEL